MKFDYKIVENIDRVSFEKEVKTLINDDWSLLGSPFIRRDAIYCQALTRVDNE